MKNLNPYRDVRWRQQRTGAQATKSLQWAASVKSESAARPEPQEGGEEWGRRRPGILGATCSTCSCTCWWHRQRRQQHTLNRVRLLTAGETGNTKEGNPASVCVTLLFVFTTVILKAQWQIGADRCLEFPQRAEPLSTGPPRDRSPLPLPCWRGLPSSWQQKKEAGRLRFHPLPLSRVDIRLQSDVTPPRRPLVSTHCWVTESASGWTGRPGESWPPVRHQGLFDLPLQEIRWLINIQRRSETWGSK